MPARSGFEHQGPNGRRALRHPERACALTSRQAETPLEIERERSAQAVQIEIARLPSSCPHSPHSTALPRIMPLQLSVFNRRRCLSAVARVVRDMRSRLARLLALMQERNGLALVNRSRFDANRAARPEHPSLTNDCKRSIAFTLARCAQVPEIGPEAPATDCGGTNGSTRRYFESRLLSPHAGDATNPSISIATSSSAGRANFNPVDVWQPCSSNCLLDC